MSLIEEIIESLAAALSIPEQYLIYILNKNKEKMEKWLKKNKNLIIQYLKTL